MGLLDVVDEESRTPKATDGSAVRRLHELFTMNPHYKRTHRGDAACFDIIHYAGKVNITFTILSSDIVPYSIINME